MADEIMIVAQHLENPGGFSWRFRRVDVISSESGRLSNLVFDYERYGGCSSMSFDILGAADDPIWVPRGDTPAVVAPFDDVALYVNGTVWWRGYVSAVAPLLEDPNESVRVSCEGYAYRLKHATMTWQFTEATLAQQGSSGGVHGLVEALLLTVPYLLGVTENPHPVCDSYSIDSVPFVPDRLIFSNEQLWSAIEQLAVLAGNFDWGVDQMRQFYFHSPMPRGVLTEYTTDPAEWRWNNTGAGKPDGIYVDALLRDPQPTPPDLEVVETVVVGSDVVSIDDTRPMLGAKTTLYVYMMPRVAGEEVQVAVVSDDSAAGYWRQRLAGRVSTTIFDTREAAIRWGRQRLRLLAYPQVRGSVVTLMETPRLTYPRGALRILYPGGVVRDERISSVQYRLTRDGAFERTINIEYAPPPEALFAQHIDRDLTLAQNVRTSMEPFVLQETMRWFIETGASIS